MLKGVQFTSSLEALRVAPKHGINAVFGRTKLNRRAESMCMKKHKLYRPKSLSKEEQKYLDAQIRREIIMTIVVMILGIAVVVGIFAMTKKAAGL